LLPVTTFVMMTEPLGDKLHELVRYRGAVSDTNRADNHYRIVGENRLQWSGRMRAWQADPASFKNALVADIKRNYPDLGEVNVAHLWRGTLGRTVHRMPQIGAMAEGVWLASGFGGHGLNTTAMGGELVARGIVEGDQTWRLFAPYELVWAGGRLGSAIAQGLYWARSPMEQIKANVSRYRERRANAKRQRREAAEQAGAVVLPIAASPVELVAAPVPEPESDKIVAPSETPSDVSQRRRNRGKRRKRKMEPAPPA
jgi:hypothetical protein